MKYVRGNAVTGILVTLGIVVVVGFGLVATYVSNYNYGNRTEAALEAKLEMNKNVLSAYSLKIKEMAQIPDMYEEGLINVVTASMEGRYGDDGSSATWQWIQEQNPNVDPAVYVNIQTAMNAGREEFKNTQNELVDLTRAYRTNLGYLWKGFWLRTAGYPTVDLSKYEVVLSGYAEETFNVGIDKGLEIN